MAFANVMLSVQEVLQTHAMAAVHVALMVFATASANGGVCMFILHVLHRVCYLVLPAQVVLFVTFLDT